MTAKPTVRAIKRILPLALLLLASVAFLSAQEGEAKEGHGEAEVSQVWKWANFIILAAGLGYLMGKALPPFFRDRTSEIQKGIAEARVLKEDADKRAAQVEAKIKSLGADIEKFRVESKSEMQQEADRISKETTVHLLRLEAQAIQEIESAGKTAQREMKSYAAKLALDLAEQRVRGRLDGNTEAGLVNGFVQDLGRMGSSN